MPACTLRAAARTRANLNAAANETRKHHRPGRDPPPAYACASAAEYGARGTGLALCAMTALAWSTAAHDVDGDHWRPPSVHRLDDLGVVDSLQVHRRDPEVAVAELPLDHHERYAFVGEFDG